MELIIFVGMPASGKSTFYQQRFAATHTLVSKDRMSAKNKQPRQLREIAEALTAGHSVVVDNTNPTVADRAPLIALGREHGATTIGYFFISSVADALARNRGREGKARVPDVAIYTSAKRLTPPTSAEGFDALFTVTIAGNGEFTVTEMEPPYTPK